MDTLELGPVPHEERCAQVGQEGYPEMAKKECRRYIALLTRMFGEPPARTAFKVQANEHEFGVYYEVAILFDSADDESTTYAFWVDSCTPAFWSATTPRNPHPKGGLISTGGHLII